MKAIAYLHSSRESMYELGDKLGLKDKALSMFSFAACEVEIELEVNEQTGIAFITKLDGRNVESFKQVELLKENENG